MRRKRVAAYLDISLATLDRLRADPANNFPAAIRLGEGGQAICWRLEAIESWLASRPRVLH